MKSRRESRRTIRESCFHSIIVVGMFGCRTLNSQCHSCTVPEVSQNRPRTVQCPGLEMIESPKLL